MIDMTTGGEGRKIIRFSLPLLAGSMLQQFYNVADSMIVGRMVGGKALASVGATFPLVFLLVALIMGITMGLTVLVAQYKGARDARNVRRTIETAAFTLLIATMVITTVGLLSSRSVLLFLKTPPEVLDDAVRYIQIMFAGMLFMFGYNTVSAILRGLGDSRTPLVLLIISTLINISLDMLFIGVLHTGVEGAAWATVIAQGVSFVGALLYLRRTRPEYFPPLRDVAFHYDIFRRSLSIGLPSGVQQVLVASGMMALSRIVNPFGPDAVAGFTAAGRIDAFAVMPAMSLAMALSTFTGQNIGAGKPERVRRGVMIALMATLGISVAVSIAVVLGGRYFMMLFTDVPGIIAVGRDYLLIVGPFYAAFGVMFAYNGALRGAGDTVVPMIVTLFSLWLIRVPAAALLSERWGVNGVWWGIPLAWCPGAIAAAVYFHSGRWRRLRHVEPESAVISELECVELELKESRQ